MSSVVQIPSRSGCPHALRGAFQCGLTRLAALASADPLAWALAAGGMHMTIAATPIATRPDATRRFIQNLLGASGYIETPRSVYGGSTKQDPPYEMTKR